MSRKEVLDYLGLTEAQFRRAVALLRWRGKGRGQRFFADDVAALGQLWDRLDTLLPSAPAPENEDDE